MGTPSGEAEEIEVETEAPAAPTADSLIGTTINGRFEIASFLAKGGMGSVYKGRQLPLGRVCAVKVLHPALHGDERMDFHHRFFLEASTSAKLTHPNTVTVFDYGHSAESDIYYMAMEFLDGRTLRDAIIKESPFPEERALHIARQICRSLREAHGMSVIHRDLKPANIFLVEHGDESDMVKVLDFGLVKNVGENADQQQTQAGICMGSPKYMAPEQITGAPVDGRTDIYALGILLYEMLTGRVPFDRGNGMSTIMAHVSDEVPPMRSVRPDLALSADVERIVMRCLAKLPDERFRSMDDVLHALKLTGGVGASTSSEHSARSISGGSSVQEMMGGTASLPLPALASTSSSGIVAPTGGMRSKGMVLGGAVVVAAAAVLFMVASRSGTKPAEARDGVGPASPGTIVDSRGAQPGTQAAHTAGNTAGKGGKIRVVTEPPGASVKEDGVEVCSTTPCDVRYEGPDAVPTKDHKLLVSLGGYKIETRTVHAGEGTVSVTLSKAPVVVAPAAPQSKPKPAEVPGGYKVDIPY